MIRIIDKDNIDLFATSMDQYFRLRYEVFVKELGWCKPNDQLKEIDQYDNENAAYVLSIDGNGDVVGCFRLYPTTQPHMLSEYFAQMVDGQVVQRDDVFELTRFAITPNRRDGGVVYRELYLGMLEYCISRGITGTVAVLRTTRLAPLMGIGMNLRPMGLPQVIGNESNTVVYYEMNEDVLARVQARAGVTDSVLESNSGLISRVA